MCVRACVRAGESACVCVCVCVCVVFVVHVLISVSAICLPVCLFFYDGDLNTYVCGTHRGCDVRGILASERPGAY